MNQIIGDLPVLKKLRYLRIVDGNKLIPGLPYEISQLTNLCELAIISPDFDLTNLTVYNSRTKKIEQANEAQRADFQEILRLSLKSSVPKIDMSKT